MDRSAYTEEVQKRHEALLLDVGNKLANPPSSTDELLPLLSRADILLYYVFQKPHESIKAAIRPAMDALISDKILKHTDLNIQVAVASCFNEIIRIASPDYPYTDDQMKEIFGLFMIAFKQLSSESNKNYERALEILEIVSTIRSCVIMQDIEVDSMVVKMFEIFLDTIKTNPSADVFMHMKSIMTIMVEECECDEFTEDLVRPLLSSVKLDNKNTSLRAWELGNSVIENCATKLQRHVREVVKAMNLNVADYAEIVTSLCKDTPTGNDTVAIEEVELVASTQVVNEEAREVESVRVGNEEFATPQFEATDASGEGVSKLDEGSQAMPRMQMQVERSRRGLRPNTFTRADEGYQHIWLAGGLGSSRGYYYLLSPSEHKSTDDSLLKKNDSVEKLNIGKRGQSKKQESTAKQDKAEEGSPKPTKKRLHSTVGSDKRKKAKVSHSAADPEVKDEDGHDSQKLDSGDVDKVVESPMSQPAKAKQSEVKEKRSKKGKKRSRSVVKFGVEKGNVSHSSADSVPKDENAITLVVHESADVEKVVESPISKPTKAKKSKLKEKEKKISKIVIGQSDTLCAEKEKISHGATDHERKNGNNITSQNHEKYEPADDVDKVVESLTTAKGSSNVEKEMEPTDVRLEYGQELVNLRIMVWWPIDKTYYTGTVVAFDHLAKKHKIIYDDDEEETLDMSEEIWELFNDIQSSHRPEKPRKSTIQG